jgi:hypothetical protein
MLFKSMLLTAPAARGTSNGWLSSRVQRTAIAQAVAARRTRRLVRRLAACGAVIGAALTSSGSSAYAARSVAIAGVHLGMQPGQVRRLLGAPLSKRAILPGVSLWAHQVWLYPDRLSVQFQRYDNDKRHLRVDLVVTRSPKDRFANGIHVGSPLYLVKRRFHPLRCDPYSLSNETVTLCQWYVAGVRLCVPGVNLWARHSRVYKIELTPTPADGGCPKVVRS